MAGMSAHYFDAQRDHGKTLITHIGLVNDAGVELSGGDPAYARKEVNWDNDGTGVMRPAVNLTFDVPAGTTVGGWRGYSQLVGGTDYGGKDVTQEVYAGQGQYTLLAAQTSITHTAPA